MPSRRTIYVGYHDLVAKYQLSGSVWDEISTRDSDHYSDECRAALDQMFSTYIMTKCGRGFRVSIECEPEQYQAVCDEILKKALTQFMEESEVCVDFRRDAAGVIKALKSAIAKSVPVALND